RDQLGNPEIAADDGAVALIQWLLSGFEADKQGGALDLAVKRALSAFVNRGANVAMRLADEALGQALATVVRLEKMDGDSRELRMAAFRSLQELDVGLLQSSTLADLIALGEDDQGEASAELNELFETLSMLLMANESAASAGHPTLRMRRVRALLHVVDADGSYGDEWNGARRPRRLRAVRMLLTRTRQEASSPLRRAVLACLARTCDALVREEVFELSDVILCASLYLSDPADVNTLAEASMVPELSRALTALGGLTDKLLRAADSVSVRKESLVALKELVQALPAAHSPRVSLLRSSLLRIQLVLDALRGVRSLSDIVDAKGGGNTIADLSDALQAVAQLMAGTRKRLAPNAQVRIPNAGNLADALGAAFEHVVNIRKPESLTQPLAELDECLAAELPPAFYTLVMRALSALKSLPILAPVAGTKRGALKRVTSPGSEERGLPAWLPPNRMLGGFYVLHAIGEGGVGSVFVARRGEERDDNDAEVFALKVPEYNGDVSHMLSEADFLKMFREEAGALLALPDNEENLARFVTFDAGVRPKPILVMEHVEGPSLEKLLLRRHMDVAQAFDILAGLSRGLSAMHATGIAHLDVKPSNVILRNFWGGQLTPVLVDFGLSGRRMRPGCGTANYASPEIWGAVECDDPRPADVYAFGCLAFELLTGKTLFDAPSDV
ncbi:MAG TPA: protein kinase, partial [Polyangiales bacterium]|nr:protein kinase [Polyangiales bacterium]